jgi:hypothetical protein
MTDHSTIAECDHAHASCFDARFARHSQVACQGTGAACSHCEYDDALILYIHIHHLVRWSLRVQERTTCALAAEEPLSVAFVLEGSR